MLNAYRFFLKLTRFSHAFKNKMKVVNNSNVYQAIGFFFTIISIQISNKNSVQVVQFCWLQNKLLKKKEKKVVQFNSNWAIFVEY